MTKVRCVYHSQEMHYLLKNWTSHAQNVAHLIYLASKILHFSYFTGILIKIDDIAPIETYKNIIYGTTYVGISNDSLADWMTVTDWVKFF